MNICVDVSYKSLNKYGEELCGDKVEVLKTKDSDIIILADGMGSGVKANILATLTTKILGTMFLNGALIEECIETIIKTLPICQVREVAYSTFSILQIFHNREAYLVEFDNPGCVFIRNGKLYHMPYKERKIYDKVIKEYRFKPETDDTFILMSDGVIHAGVGKVLNFGWTWDSMAEYSVNMSRETRSAARLATILSKACDDLYLQLPGDDTTVAAVRVMDAQIVDLFTGPPLNKSDDNLVIADFMKEDGTKIVCGGTSANIVSRVLKEEIKTSLNYTDPDLPPIAKIKGIDLVTEGVLTLTRALSLLKRYVENEVDEEFFMELDKENGGSAIAKLLIEDCTKLNLYVGKAMNEAHQNTALPFDLSIRMNLVEQLKEVLLRMGKNVNIKYY
ncbi:stage II sporulation protein E [Mobilisporobacter senegalensis]|uniref:Stage II sporulation protein E n=1 Tax=Mobilisporobacter senegalensis TaxID=1329262 RepID=A0A3N1XZA3_9FIRM|nr:SpoIIE family protein phosphatase [Mobilisporobacter senegalensis]ROR31924.1 stage II sporulation protein E [Mobilisporobacter senegalensis]